MKKILLLLTLLTTTTLYAATAAELYLQGEVTATNDLSIQANVNATSLNIVGGEVDRNVATATETSNSTTGYKILMRTANGSQLNHTVADPAYNAPYTVKYNGIQTPALTTVDQTVKTVPSLTSLTTATSDILINMSPHAGLPAGFYTDVITVSISAN
ncbi:MAG: hypothetical protein ACXWQQ_11690 [Pseudobdellovibrio sp.]